MLDIIPSDQNQLPLSIEIEGVDHAEARLAGATAPRHVQPTAEQKPVKKYQDQDDNNDRDEDDRNGGSFVIREKRAKRLHKIVCLSTPNAASVEL
ncbi:hypothetical protein [Lichenihabitans psoromatis]|uniref:hypothetical protein n=1 Tax=Lichenihabitans psoromatis TaxID=2528642 RepID=UPI001FDF01E7|nr:hypothetical protein [Lichenihabitans psoromatis]